MHVSSTDYVETMGKIASSLEINISAFWHLLLLLILWFHFYSPLGKYGIPVYASYAHVTCSYIVAGGRCLSCVADSSHDELRL